MYWRDRSLAHGAPKKRAMAALARAGGEPGLLAYEDDEPIGWVSVARREEFRTLLASRHYRPLEPETGVWSIVCFLVDRYQRRRGIAAKLLAAAMKHAFARGAAAIEAYPHRANAADYIGGIWPRRPTLTRGAV